MFLIFFNTFIYKYFLFDKVYEPFRLENAINLTHLTRNVLLNFLIKIVINTRMSNLMHFKKKYRLFIFPQKGRLRRESVNFKKRKLILYEKMLGEIYKQTPTGE